MAAVFLAVTAVLAVRSAHAWTGNDFRIYGVAGETMLSGAWLHAYANPLVQAGPLELGLDGTLYRLSRLPVAMALVSDLLVAVMFVAAVRVFAGRKALPLAVACAGAVALGIVTNPYTLGHFAEPIGAILWLFAARDAQRGRVLRAGLLVGIAAGFEPWGILGIAVLALAPDLRDALRGAAVAGGVLALLFMPFALGGHFHMLDYHWHVTGGPLRLVMPGHSFGWPERAAAGGGHARDRGAARAARARRRRGRVHRSRRSRDRPPVDRPDGHVLLLGRAAHDRARRRRCRARQPRRDPRVGRAQGRARGRDAGLADATPCASGRTRGRRA